MLARLRSLLSSAASGFGVVALAIVEDDIEDRSEERRAVVRYGMAMTDALMRLRCGHGLDEAARLDLEGGAERVVGYLTMSGRDPPP